MKADQEYESRKLMEKCPRFIRCNAPICPLDLLQDDRDFILGEPKCTMAKSIRMRIGKNSGLPHMGLTKMEWAASLRYRKLSLEEREQFKNRGREQLRCYQEVAK